MAPTNTSENYAYYRFNKIVIVSYVPTDATYIENFDTFCSILAEYVPVENRKPITPIATPEHVSRITSWQKAMKDDPEPRWHPWKVFHMPVKRPYFF